MSNYTVKSTSSQTADVTEPLVSSLRDDPDGSRVRRLVLATCVANPRDARARLAINVRHQRRASLAAEWADVDLFGPARLEPGQEIRLDFSTAETLALYDRLTEWYALCGRGVEFGERRLRVVDENQATVLEGSHREILRALMGSKADIWSLLEEMAPDLLTAATAARVNRVRTEAVATFAAHVKARDWNEPAWQEFFESNVWIFGHGLAFQFLRQVAAQPAYGGSGIDRTGLKIGDFLMATEARARFTVLVEIKKPQTDLLGDEYRKGIYSISKEVSGGVAQVQTAARTWVLEGSRAEGNKDVLDAEGVETYEPRGIVVVGDTVELKDRNRRRSFELFRRNLHNPEIVTFDELLARASYLVNAGPNEAAR